MTSLESLDGVKEEDRALVNDVILLLGKLQHPKVLCKGWNCNPFKGYYEVIGKIDTSHVDWEVHFDDLELVRKLDLFRIPTVSVRISGGNPQVRVRIIPRSERCVIQTQDILRVERKRKWYDFLLSN